LLIAILSDTHLSDPGRPLPAKCVELMRSAELIVHAGDFMTLAVLEQIESLGPPVKAVHGNMDTAELRRRVPAEVTFSAQGHEIGVIHDAGAAQGRLARLRARFPAADAVIFGHSHMPLHETSGGFQIFNPGSPTQRRRAPRHTMGLARVTGPSLLFEHVDLS
jgi:putative phosphoesterase